MYFFNLDYYLHTLNKLNVTYTKVIYHTSLQISNTTLILLTVYVDVLLKQMYFLLWGKKLHYNNQNFENLQTKQYHLFNVINYYFMLNNQYTKVTKFMVCNNKDSIE